MMLSTTLNEGLSFLDIHQKHLMECNFHQLEVENEVRERAGTGDMDVEREEV